MAKRSRSPKKSRPDRKKIAQDYVVGYGRPPQHSRFKPGQSGNRKGRPRGRVNLRTVVEHALNERIEIRDRDRTRTLSKLAGVVQAVVNKSVKGDARAQATLITLLRALRMTAETPEPTGTEQITTHDAEIIADFFRRRGVSTEDDAASEHSVENPPSNGREQ